MNINPKAVTKLLQNTVTHLSQDNVTHVNIPETKLPITVDPSPNKTPKRIQRKKNKKNLPSDKEDNRCLNDFEHVVLGIIDKTNAKAKVEEKRKELLPKAILIYSYHSEI